MGTSTDIIIVEKSGDFSLSAEEGTSPMEVFPATRAADEPPRQRTMLMMRLGAMVADEGVVGTRSGEVRAWEGSSSSNFHLWPLFCDFSQG
jgi:hypothetical protein